MKQDFFKRQFVANCHCAANKEAIFEYTYNQTFGGEKTGEVDILFLLEFKERDFLNKNFVSLVKHVLKEKYKYAIIPGLGCTPKGFSSGDTVNTYSTCKSANIKKRILEYNPKVIVTTGRSLYTITEMKDLKPDHFFSLHRDEKYLYSPEFKCNVVPLPPLFTWNSNNMMLDVFEFDHTKKQIQLACELSEQPKARVPKLNYIKLDNPNEFIKKLIEDPSIVDLSVDIETSGLDYFRDELYSIQFAFNETDGYFAFFKDIDKDLLIKLFALKRICFIFQNGQFDVKFLKANGIHNARNDFDTMYASYVLNENKPKGLKPNTWIFTKYGGYETKLKKSLNDEEVRKNFTKVPINILLEYACTDAIITYILKKYFEKRLLEEDEDVRNNFYNIMMKATDMIIEVEYTGIQLDRVYLNEYAESMRKEAKEIEDEIYKLAGRSFNLNSKKELTKVLEKVPGFVVLKDEEGNELRTKTGDLQLGRDIMDMYAEKGFPLAKKISHYYHIQKELSQIRDAEAEKVKTVKDDFKQRVLFEIDEDLIDLPIEEQDGFLASVYDNRLHGGFDLGGTDTGRMASRGGLRSSVNFQNFTKKESFRKLFLPIKDHVFIEADYEGMEVGQASQISGTGPLEENLLLGKDMHSFLASQMMKALGKINPQTGKFYTYEEIFQYAKIDEIPEFVKIRGQGKSTIFSCVTSETEILTNKGILKIDQIVPEVNKGQFTEFSDNSIKLIGRDSREYEISHSIFSESKEIIDFELDDGTLLSVTPDHQMIILRNGIEMRVDAKEVLETDELVQSTVNTSLYGN
jgi:DNA polymerase I-like protein with 3'-5' exonuclease and polymerase domains